MEIVLGERFRLGDRIGEGSTGRRVYVATDEQTGTPVAVKVFARTDPAEAHEEVRRLERCRHPNVVAFYGSGLEVSGPLAGSVWLAMDLADLTLADLVDDSGGMVPWPVLRPIVVQVLRGLAYLHHDHGLTHRDIKPDNVLAIGDVWHVADLGLASRSSTGGGAGSYVAPEVRAGALATPRSDLWSVGAVVVRCLTGTVPDPGQPLAEQVPEEARRFVDALLAVEPGNRPASAVEALTLLGAGGVEPPGGPGGVGMVSPGPRRRRVPRLARVGLVLVPVLLLAVALAVLRDDSDGGGTRIGAGGSPRPSSSTIVDAAASGEPLPTVDTTCRNEYLGYSVEVPSGWYAFPGDDEWDDCQVFDDHPFTKADDPAEAAIVFETQVPYLMVRDAADRGVTVNGTSSWIVDRSDNEPPMRAVAIPRGGDVLVGSVLGSDTDLARSESALRLMLDSIRFLDRTCLDTRDVRCGSFLWEPEPAPNEPLEITATPDRTEVVVGETVTVTVVASDADADRVEISQPNAGQLGVVESCIGALPRTDGLEFRTRHEPPGGPWRPPRRQAGSDTAVITFRLEQAGPAYLCINAFSSSSSKADGVPDPYSSRRSVSVEVNVSEPPSAEPPTAHGELPPET